jgi:hypothetical protein
VTFLYFAYGSNMLSARLKARYLSAKVIGKATAIGHALEFTKRGKDSSGKATLVSAAGHDTPGVLFEIAKSDLVELDRAEGAGRGYDRNDEFRIELAGENAARVATTYLASEAEAHLKPYDWYLALVIAGANEHQLGPAHSARLRQIEYVIDDHLTRDGRTVALDALSKHGFDDYDVLLSRL